MAKTAGLFTREEVRLGVDSTKRGKVSLDDAPAQHLWNLGLKGVEGMNRHAAHPHMEATGAKKPVVYVLGEAPDEEDDHQNKHFVGRPGRVLRGEFPDGYEEYVRFNNCVRTRPPNNRPPTRVEIECYRQSVVADIEQTRPLSILGLGAIPLHWAVGDVGSITISRGRRFPVRVGKHCCWFYPIHAPGYILRVEHGEEKGEGKETIGGDQWRKAFNRDIELCFKQTLKDPTVPTVEDPAHYFDNIEVLHRREDLPRIIKLLRGVVEEGKPATLDFETNRLRPYGKGAKVLTAAIGGRGRAFAFPIDHPQAGFSGTERNQLLFEFERFIRSPIPKVAQNLMMELEWLVFLCGATILRTCTWHDTMIQAYTLDERVGGHNLNFLSALSLGFTLKDSGLLGLQSKAFDAQDLFQALQLKARHDAETDLDKARLEFEDLKKLLLYNGLDSKYTRPVFFRQRERLREEELENVYHEQLRKAATLTLSQAIGFPIKQEQVVEMVTEYEEKQKQALVKIMASPEVVKYKKKYGEFNPESNNDVKILLRDVMGRTEGQKGKKYSVDEEVLDAIGAPVCKHIISFRKATKMKGTYLDPLDIRNKGTVVYPDGRVHTKFNLTLTSTGRLSSEGPNLHNQPKRNPETKRVRKCFIPPKKCEGYAHLFRKAGEPF